MLFLFVLKKKEKEKFSNVDCIIKKELLQMITPSKIGTSEEDLELSILKDSGIIENDEILKIKKYIKKNGILNTFKNFYKC
jgi:hypothetical protein